MQHPGYRPGLYLQVAEGAISFLRALDSSLKVLRKRRLYHTPHRELDANHEQQLQLPNTLVWLGNKATEQKLNAPRLMLIHADYQYGFIVLANTNASREGNDYYELLGIDPQTLTPTTVSFISFRIPEGKYRPAHVGIINRLGPNVPKPLYMLPFQQSELLGELYQLAAP